MTEPTSQRRLIGRLLLGAAALALPLTASITYAASGADDPVAAPAPPAAPAAPAAPEIKKVTKVVIVDNPGGKPGDDKDLHTRVVERNGKTIVLKTKQPLSDAEAEKRVAEVEARLGSIDNIEVKTEVFDTPGAHSGHQIVMVKRVDGDGKDGDAKVTERREVRTFVLHGDGKDADMAKLHGGAMVMTGCSEGKPIEARTESTVNGERKTSRVMICSKGGDKAQALAGLKQARDRVANDPNLSGDIKGEVLKQLDEEIAKLS